ncbi:adenosylmethionine--8-amino-7-oxononanoate transaminase [bacterium]|jgi:adenosylmethionine---8-amino-7-oxononanoate aminotransferase|nr:adenosylmethionine--8-amino-7-oxononanoate transaminase [bacterium]
MKQENNRRTEHIWYPYTQMGDDFAPKLVEEAKGVNLKLDGQWVIDGISSWWSVLHGYNHHSLNDALKFQIDKFSHVMIGGLIHEPAIELAKSLSTICGRSLNRVFFSDSGSVGIEVAIKLSIQYWMNKKQATKSKLICFKKSYHGDTTGAMSISDPEDSMHHIFSPILMKHHFFDAPSSDPDIKRDQLKKIDVFLSKKHDEIAAIVLEPLVQCAGGFNFFTPDYLDELRNLADKHDVLLIYDEVATGFCRTGTFFAYHQSKTEPDILVCGKGLTGGYLGLAATITSDKVFRAFYAKGEPEKAFMHGPTFMGNPLACSLAIKSIDLATKNNYSQKFLEIQKILEEGLLGFTHPLIKRIRVKGGIGVIEVYNKSDIDGFGEYAFNKGAWLRGFESFIYTMPPALIKESELRKIIGIMKDYFLDKN